MSRAKIQMVPATKAVLDHTLSCILVFLHEALPNEIPGSSAGSMTPFAPASATSRASRLVSARRTCLPKSVRR